MLPKLSAQTIYAAYLNYLQQLLPTWDTLPGNAQEYFEAQAHEAVKTAAESDILQAFEGQLSTKQLFYDYDKRYLICWFLECGPDQYYVRIGTDVVKARQLVFGV